MEKYPCVVLAYYDFEHIEKTFESLLKHTDELDFIVIENSSEFTKSLIEPYFMKLLDDGSISKYVQFDRNISNNAFEVVFRSKLIDLRSAKYVMLTDADVCVHGDDWLSEESTIMQSNPEVFACAIKLDPSNLPTRTFPDAHAWFDTSKSETEMYEEATSGLHLVLVKADELRGFLSFSRRAHLKFSDYNLRYYCQTVLHKKWVRTKRSIGRHLVWDRYADIEHPYTKMKLSRTFEQHWQHNRYCGFRVFTQDGAKRHYPWFTVVACYSHELARWTIRMPRRSAAAVRARYRAFLAR